MLKQMHEKREERKNLKSGEQLFFDAMRKFENNESLIKKKFKRFKKAAKKGHEESQWIINVFNSADNYKKATLKEAFAKTECPMGWYLAGKLCDDDESRLYYFKKSSEEYSWATVQYARLFRETVRDEMYKLYKLSDNNHKIYGELLIRAVIKWPNNPQGLLLLAGWHINSYIRYKKDDDDCECNPHLVEARICYLNAAKLGWIDAMEPLAIMFYYGDGGKQDLIEVIRWSAQGQTETFRMILREAFDFFDGDEDAIETWVVDDNTLAWALGKGLFWYMEGLDEKGLNQEQIDFGTSCMEYYCDSIDSQQKSIYTFLWCWKKLTGDWVGFANLGCRVAQMVWYGREKNPIQEYDFFIE